MRSLKFNLIENAMDSLRQGVGLVLKEKPTPSDLKLSILLIAQSVELLLKERLRSEHWSLIFKNIEQAGNSSANTVTIDEAIRRLEQIAHVKLEIGEGDTISNLSDIRNRVQHYEINIAFEGVIGIAEAAIGFITRFLKDEFKKDIRDYLDADDAEKIMYIEKTLVHLLEMANQSIDRLRRENEPGTVSDLVAWRFDVIDCPSCGQETYVFSLDSHISQCQLCKYEGGFVECARCGHQAPSGSLDFASEGPDFALCDSCWEEMVNE